MRRTLGQAWDALRSSLESLAAQAQAGELVDALDAGVLELHAFASSEVDSWIDEMVNIIREALEHGSAYPLLDAQMVSLVSAAVKEGLIKPTGAGVTRTRETGFAQILLSDLPGIGAAPMSDVLAARRELLPYVQRFRAAVIALSRKIADEPWSEDFEYWARQVIQEDVVPSVKGIEDACKTNTLLRRLADKYLTQPVATTGGLALVLGNLPLLRNDIAKLRPVALGLVPVLATLYAARQEHKEAALKTEANTLYFMYKAGQIIG